MAHTNEAEVPRLPSELLPNIRSALAKNYTGAYLCGSLALGEYVPATSDVDILVVTERVMSDAEMLALAAVHAETPPSYTVPGRDYEVYYIDQATLRRFAPGQRHVKVGPDDPIGWTEHRPSWVIERWVLREHGVVLDGPGPKRLIDPVSADEMRWAAGAEIATRLENWRTEAWPRDDLGHRGSQAFEVETVCRALHTAETGEASSKRAAVAWALGMLPERWHELIEWSQRYKKDPTQDPTRVSDALAFLRWGVTTAAIARLPVEVRGLLSELAGGAVQALEDNLVGFYLRGSLALGDFDPATSDVDLLVVTDRPVSDAEYQVLDLLHTRINPRENEFGRQYEISYIDHASIRRFEPHERVHPSVGADWVLSRSEHYGNFAVERWIVREHGVALVGPDPATLIDPVPPEELREASRYLLRLWAHDWQDGPPDWLAPRNYQAFALETACRALHTIATGEVHSKPQSARWAIANLPEPWRSLVERSQVWRDETTADTRDVAEIVEFVRWAAVEGT